MQKNSFFKTPFWGTSKNQRLDLNSLQDNEKEITGYRIILPLTTTVQKVARLVLLVKEELQVKVTEEFMDVDIATVWIKIGTTGRKPIYLSGIYREHRFLFQDTDDSASDRSQIIRWRKFVEAWKRAAVGDKNVIVIGDTNLDFLRWDDPEPNKEAMVDKTKDDIEMAGFSQIVQGFTRTWPGQPNSLLDQCWINCQNRLQYIKNLPRNFSDHNMLLLSIKMKEKCEDSHETLARDRKEWDAEEYARQVGLIDWSPLMNTENIDLANDYFHSKISEILDKMAPLKKYQARKHKANWLSQEIKDLMTKRESLKIIANNSGLQEDNDNFRKTRNKVVTELRKTKSKYYEELYEKIDREKNTKSLYKLTNQLCQKKTGTSPQRFLIDGKLTSKPAEVANHQLDFYIKKIQEIKNKIPITDRNPHRFLDKALSDWVHKDERPIFEFKPINLNETKVLISTLSTSPALGHDNLDALAIKSAGDKLLIPLQRLVNLSLTSARYAMKWKISKINPRLKSRGLDTMEASNYRPVAVLSVTSKMIERVAQKQLLDYMEKTGQMNESCHAYRTNRSTTTTLTNILDQVYQGIENNEIVSLMAIDQSSAFDCVNRDKLIEKLQRYNIGPGARDWIKDYLSNRTQYVVVGASNSRMVAVCQGVPQGSVIGPLLYAIMTNEMTEVVKDRSCRQVQHNDNERLFGSQCPKCGIMSLYADDSTYAVTSPDRMRNQISILRVIDEISLYLTDNDLAINMSKTQLNEVMIGQKRGKISGSPPTMKIQTKPGTWKTIENKSHFRILGANIQGNALWQAHLETGEKALFPALRKQLGMLKHLGSKIPKTSRNKLVKGLIHSRFAYLIPLWGGASKNLVRKAQVILNNAARWCSGLGKRTRVMDLMKAVGWFSIREQIEMATAQFTWKVLNLKIPRMMADRLTLDDEKKICIRRPRLLFSTNWFRWRAAVVWNNLPLDIRSEQSISIFKNSMKRLMTERREISTQDQDPEISQTPGTTG